MEERFQQVIYKGATIVVLDLSNLQDDKEIIRLLRLRSPQQEPHGLLFDLTNAHYSMAIMDEAKKNAKEARPLLKAFAAVGTGGIVAMLVSGVSKFSGMNIATFSSRQEAMDWLAKQ